MYSFFTFSYKVCKISYKVCKISYKVCKKCYYDPKISFFLENIKMGIKKQNLFKFVDADLKKAPKKSYSQNNM
jgi:hypothetical protein